MVMGWRSIDFSLNLNIPKQVRLAGLYGSIRQNFKYNYKDKVFYHETIVDCPLWTIDKFYSFIFQNMALIYFIDHLEPLSINVVQPRFGAL